MVVLQIVVLSVALLNGITVDVVSRNPPHFPATFGNPVINGEVATFPDTRNGGFGVFTSFNGQTQINSAQTSIKFDITPTTGYLDVMIEGGDWGVNSNILTLDADPVHVSDVQTVDTFHWQHHKFIPFVGGELAVTAYIRVNSHETLGQQNSIGLSNMTIRYFATPPLQGDFNYDGLVDAMDYIYWRKSQEVAADYTSWRANYGVINPIGSGTPEPNWMSWFLVSPFLIRRRYK